MENRKILLSKNSCLNLITNDAFKHLKNLENENSISEKDSVFEKYSLEQFADIWIKNLVEQEEYVDIFSRVESSKECFEKKVRDEIISLFKITNISNFGKIDGSFSYEFDESLNSFYKTNGYYFVSAYNYHSYKELMPFSGDSKYNCFANNDEKCFYVLKYKTDLIEFRTNPLLIKTYYDFLSLKKDFVYNKSTKHDLVCVDIPEKINDKQFKIVRDHKISPPEWEKVVPKVTNKPYSNLIFA